jgi:hypothetical protein
MSEATKKAPGGMSLLARYAKASKEKRALEEKLKLVEDRLKELDPQVLDHMQRHGITKTTCNGVTIYVARDLWASVAKDDQGDNAAGLDALKAFPATAFMVKDNVNTQTLSSWVRELPANPEGMPILPAEVASAIKVSETFKVRTRKA